MVQARKLAFASLLSLLLTSCGGHSASPLQAPNYSSLDGNWRLVGQSSSIVLSSKSDYIGLAIDVDGGTIYARGNALAIPVRQALNLPLRSFKTASVPTPSPRAR